MGRHFHIFILTISLAGCSEFTAPVERTTSIDLVGDASDQATDSHDASDIFGAGSPINDTPEAVAKSTNNDVTEPSREDPDSPQASDEPDVAGGVGIAKPVSLKKKSSD